MAALSRREVLGVSQTDRPKHLSNKGSADFPFHLIASLR